MMTRRLLLSNPQQVWALIAGAPVAVVRRKFRSIGGRCCRLVGIAVLFLLGAGLSADDDLAAHSRGALAQLRAGDLSSALDELGAVVDAHGIVWREGTSPVAAAAGGVYRALSQLDSNERYELLMAWTIPTAERRTIRLLTSPVPYGAPPKEFARVLGERPREASFVVSEINGIPGLFCSGWSLAQAADDTGRLSRLIADLEPLASENVPQAAELLAIAKIVDRSADGADGISILQQRETAVREAGPAAPVSTADFALAVCALRRDELQPASANLLTALSEVTRHDQSPRLCALLRIAHAVATQLQHGESGPEVLFQQQFKYWVQVTGGTAAEHAGGGARSVWLTHEEHLLHLAGMGNDVLLCRFPLSGQFEFHCEAQIGGDQGTSGGLVFGGLNYEADGAAAKVIVHDADFQSPFGRACYFLRPSEQPTFNRLSMRATATENQFLTNLHPMWFDDGAARASPWLGLRSTGASRPLFRNLQVSGAPSIPREVQLSEGNELRGWQSGLLGGTQPPFVPHERPEQYPVGPHTKVIEQPQWRLNEGVISAGRQEVPADKDQQALLRYQRPLLEGETITYEFRHVPGEIECHPALGRLVYLLEPEGVRIHWITDGADEWTGLPADNATLEPLNRRGPRPLPLKVNEWNSVGLSRMNDALNLTLNGELIYVRPVDMTDDACFGLFHDRSATAVEVRRVVMTGDWPESLPQDFLDQPMQLSAAVQSPADRHERARLIGGRALGENVNSVLQQTHQLPAEERYQLLSDWVLPCEEHTEFRVAGLFSQTNPSPLARATLPAVQRSVDGAELVAPVLDLLDAAVELGRLAELQARVAASPVPPDELGQRSRLALLVMLGLELGDAEIVDTSFALWLPLVEQSQPAVWYEMWPEVMLVHRGMQRFSERAVVNEMLAFLFQQRVMRNVPPWCDREHSHIAVLRGLQRYLNSGGTREMYFAKSEFQDWIPASRERARTRGEGGAIPRWLQTDELGIEHYAGHQEDYLFYRTPLRGDYEVNGEIYSYGTTQFLVGGEFWGPNSPRDKIDRGTFRMGTTRLPIDVPFGKFDDWMPVRAKCVDGELSVSVYGREVARTRLEHHEDPWLGVHTWWRNAGRLRSMQVIGPGDVRPSVVMSAEPGLYSWLPYYEETVGGTTSDWTWMSRGDEPGEIVGRMHQNWPGIWEESLLRYQRPFVEDGTITYDFWYEPGKSITHPALDRLTLILDPGGVIVHWNTDGQFDPTGVSPENLTIEPENRRGSAPLPLKPGDWNHLELGFEGDQLALTLNGTLIYERAIEAENLRTFGLFHFKDQSEVRVRNVIMTGDWPPIAPPLADQQMTDRLVLKLDAERDAMRNVFEHDFSSDGLADEFFKPLGRDSENAMEVLPGRGVRQLVISDGTWTIAQFGARFSIEGDFDIEAEFSELDLEHAQGQSELDLLVRLSDELELRMGRAKRENGEPFLKAQLSRKFPEGGRSYEDQVLTDESTRGRVRVARRGARCYMLFAQADSPRYRSVGSWEISASPVDMEGIRNVVIASKGGYASGVWRKLTVRGERLLYLSPDTTDRRALFVMDADGTRLREIARPLPGLTLAGSPEWSADGAQIALDMSTGPTTTSRIVLMNADGTNVRDIAAGCMPSFSPDGERLVMSVPRSGIVMLKADGSEEVVVDSDGWGVQWSPDGKSLAYGKSGNVVVHDIETGQQRNLLSGDFALRYSYIYWNLGWSQDSRFVAFKGRRRSDGEEELSVIEVGPPNRLQVLVSPATGIAPDMGWTADSEFVSFSMLDPTSGGHQIHLVRRDGSTPPELFRSETQNLRINDCAWSRDGKFVAFTADKKLVPMEWPLTGRE